MLPATAVLGDRLKVHLMSGDLVVLDSWARRDTALAGGDVRYGLQRRVAGQGDFVIPFDSIALLESEVRIGSRPTPAVGRRRRAPSLSA